MRCQSVIEKAKERGKHSMAEDGDEGLSLALSVSVWCISEEGAFLCL